MRVCVLVAHWCNVEGSAGRIINEDVRRTDAMTDALLVLVLLFVAVVMLLMLVLVLMLWVILVLLE